jgi:hypothetical protein
MSKPNRRRTIIAVTALTFGAAGFVSSGALTVGSQGSLGDNWIQVAGTEQSVTFSSLGQVGGEDSSSGEATGSEGTTGGDDRATDAIDDTDAGTGSSTLVSTSVEVPVDPAAANSLNSAESAICDGSLFETATILRRLTNTCVESVIVN